jgi:hypothetical protein
MPNPYAGYADATEVVANYLLNMITVGASALGVDPTKGVWYGDQTLLPTTPLLCVIPGPEAAVPQGAGGRPMQMTFTTFVMVYYGKVQDQQLNIHASLTLANAVKRLVHTDPFLGGNVINCYCSAVDPGIAAKGGALIDATRMAFQSRSKVVLNPS